MLLSSLFSSSSLPRSPSEQIALDDAPRLECPSFFSPLFSLLLCPFFFCPFLHLFIYSDGKTRKRSERERENERRVKREEEGESKTNKRIRGRKIVLKDLKLSFCQYALSSAKRGLEAVSSLCPASSGTAELHKVGVCCPLYDGLHLAKYEMFVFVQFLEYKRSQRNGFYILKCLTFQRGSQSNTVTQCKTFCKLWFRRDLFLFFKVLFIRVLQVVL